MTNPDNENENETLTFQPLAAFAARVLAGNNQQNENRTGDGAGPQSKAEKAEQHRAHVEQGLRHIAAFERRARGLKRL